MHIARFLFLAGPTTDLPAFVFGQNHSPQIHHLRRSGFLGSIPQALLLPLAAGCALLGHFSRGQPTGRDDDDQRCRPLAARVGKKKGASRGGGD